MTLVYQDPDNAANMIRVIPGSTMPIPNGWILQGGSDGAADRDVQAFVPGQASGGYPTYPAIDGEQTDHPDLATLEANLLWYNGTPDTATSPLFETTLYWDIGRWDRGTWG